jgi:hypothetical protein
LAAVARSSHAQPQNKAHLQPHLTPPTQNATAAQPHEDLRILVRVPEEHQEWAKSLSNYALREATCKALGLSLIDIPDIHHTAIGFAIRPRNKAIRQKILAKEQDIGRCLKATKIELPTIRYNYVMPNCPARLNNFLGETVDINKVIEDEVTAQTNLKQSAYARRSMDQTLSQAKDLGSCHFWKRSRLSGITAYSRLIEKKRPMPVRHDPGCQGYHTNRVCTRTPRCETAGNQIMGINHTPNHAPNQQDAQTASGPHLQDIQTARPSHIERMENSSCLPERNLLLSGKQDSDSSQTRRTREIITRTRTQTGLRKP